MSVIKLPAELDIYDDFDVFINGVPQRSGVDFEIEGHTLVFQRTLRKDRVSGRRWLLGAWGIGTYRQDDTVDIRYEVNERPRLAHDLAFTVLDEADPDQDDN